MITGIVKNALLILVVAFIGGVLQCNSEHPVKSWSSLLRCFNHAGPLAVVMLFSWLYQQSPKNNPLLSKTVSGQGGDPKKD